MQKKILLLVILGLFVFQTNSVLSFDSSYDYFIQLPKLPKIPKSPDSESAFNISNEALNMVIKENAPIVYLHSDDHYRPGNVDDYLEATDLYHGNSRLGKASEQNLKNLDKNHHLKITDTHIIRGNIEKSKTYVRVKHKENSLYIQYFFFYPYNGAGSLNIHTSLKNFRRQSLAPFGEHQGDWEHIIVKLNDDNFNIQEICIYQHGDAEILTKKEMKEHMTFDKGHPVVYSSRNGHATYYKPGSNLTSSFVTHFEACINILVKKVCKSVFTVRGGLRNDCDENGIRYDTSQRISLIAVENISGIEVSTPDWYYYKGQWGPSNKNRCDKVVHKVVSRTIPRKSCVAGKWCVDPQGRVEKLIASKISDAGAYGNGPTGPEDKSWWD